MPDSSEQRQTARYLIQLPLLLRPLGPVPGRAEVGWTLNLSEAGTCVELAERLQPSTPPGPLSVEGVIAWVEPPERRASEESIRHGLRFTILSWSTSLSLGLFLLFVAETPDESARQGQAQPRRGERTRAGRGSCVLSTRLPNRMPVILAPGDDELWLDPPGQDAKRPGPLLRLYISDEMVTPVGSLGDRR